MSHVARNNQTRPDLPVKICYSWDRSSRCLKNKDFIINAWLSSVASSSPRGRVGINYNYHKITDRPTDRPTESKAMNIPLPISQCIPLKPRGGLQVHLYRRSGSISHVPLLLQGFLIHGVISQLEPLNPGGQRHRRYPRSFTHVPLLLQPCCAQ